MENLKRWQWHNRMTDPGSEASHLNGLPTEIGALCRIIQGVLIHSEWTAAYGLPVSGPGVSRETLPLSRRIQLITQNTLQPLTVRRMPGDRSVGTCRDFALMLCGMLRHQGIPARVRCGFAAYFESQHWEDHWICEYWLSAEGRWRRVDAQLDDVLRERLEIGFDATDVPRDVFMTAGDAWHLCRRKQADPSLFGQGTARGQWFIRINVVRDQHALNDSETSIWDGWRQAIGRHELVAESDQEATDRIAEDPESTNVVATPPWMVETKASR